MLPLAWPRDPNAKPIHTPIDTQGPTADTGISALTATLETRQLIAEAKVHGKPGALRVIEIRATLSQEAEWIRVGLYYFEEPHRAEIEVFAPSLDAPRFKKGQTVPLAIDLRENMKPGTYRVEVQPCGPRAKCGDQTAATFEVKL